MIPDKGHFYIIIGFIGGDKSAHFDCRFVL